MYEVQWLLLRKNWKARALHTKGPPTLSNSTWSSFGVNRTVRTSMQQVMNLALIVSAFTSGCVCKEELHTIQVPNRYIQSSLNWETFDVDWTGAKSLHSVLTKLRNIQCGCHLIVLTRYCNWNTPFTLHTQNHSVLVWTSSLASVNIHGTFLSVTVTHYCKRYCSVLIRSTIILIVIIASLNL